MAQATLPHVLMHGQHKICVNMVRQSYSWAVGPAKQPPTSYGEQCMHYHRPTDSTLL